MGRVSTKLQPDFLSNFIASIIKMQESIPVEGFIAREEFQKSITLELFNLNVRLSSTRYLNNQSIMNKF